MDGPGKATIDMLSYLRARHCKGTWLRTHWTTETVQLLGVHQFVLPN